MRFQCPYCKEIHTSAKATSGGKAKCTCGKEFTIEAIPRPESPAPKPAVAKTKRKPKPGKSNNTIYIWIFGAVFLFVGILGAFALNSYLNRPQPKTKQVAPDPIEETYEPDTPPAETQTPKPIAETQPADNTPQPATKPDAETQPATPKALDIDPTKCTREAGSFITGFNLLIPVTPNETGTYILTATYYKDADEKIPAYTAETKSETFEAGTPRTVSCFFEKSIPEGEQVFLGIEAERTKTALTQPAHNKE